MQRRLMATFFRLLACLGREGPHPPTCVGVLLLRRPLIPTSEQPVMHAFHRGGPHSGLPNLAKSIQYYIWTAVCLR